jgi:hypothetical protein
LGGRGLYTNKIGSEVLANKVGWAGIILVKLGFYFYRVKPKKPIKSHTVVAGKKTME